MIVTSPYFAQLLHQSSLSPDEQEAVLKMLPRLSWGQIERLQGIFEKDVESVQKVFAEADSKRKRLMLQMALELEKH